MDSLDPRKPAPLESAFWRSTHCLVPVIYLATGLVFVLDLIRTNTLAYGIVYAPLIATAVYHRHRPGLWVLSGIACLLVLIGAILPLANAAHPDLMVNRILAILAIIATAAFVHHARDIQDRLASATRRAEAAERIKTDVLTDLGQHIRTPFHALLGIVSLTMASSRPDQREALGRVRHDGNQLLAKIDNLLDLTQIDDLQLRRQTIDLAAVARDAAESMRAAASERQIRITLQPDRPCNSGETTAIGDSWAMRRILDNLLANAVRLSPPGGSVSVAVARVADTVTASVSDTGKGLPPSLVHGFDPPCAPSTADPAPAPSSVDPACAPSSVDPASTARTDNALATTGATGLALSNRLARAMNGRLTAHNTPSSGATVSLSLPAA